MKIKFSKIFKGKKKPIELLYDYSKAKDGYITKVHRDTDQRVIVFLLYLNQLPQEAGGELELYENTNVTDDIYPDIKNCKLIEKIKPEPGKLVLFLNGTNSYHGTTILKGANSNRHFLYGGYTLLRGNNPFLKKSNKKLNTGYYLYD